ncbi:MAG TPA: type II toxin-antitoxin system RelE/ParE family toxin [Candidatus Methylacidiphilales bacterium]|jgi:plasmid stabilization system protein ParE|nr:type II toxin-antitoxin system RelE/ParE family toxin [Candidatus Methylacidiphilales bacterium]
MKIEFLDEAEEDLIAGYHFYEKQGEGLGEYFLDSIYAEIQSLTLTAGIHAKVFGSHRYVAKRFPYAIFYRVEGGCIRVRAVWDCRKHPGKLRRQLKERPG